MYGDADCNGHATRRLYQERYPNTRVRYHTTFTRVNRRLHETGSFTNKLVLFGVRETPVFSVEDHISQIFVASGRIRDMPGILQNVRNSKQCRCQVERKLQINCEEVEALWLSGSIARFRTKGLGFKSRAEQGQLSLSSLQWIDK
ncbi:hypothetical protein TNCV_1976481 [Trichonephila clavipes]|nr:hypothetical protein TNCV_1976481 [Trichonephila clavipes]